MATDLGNRTEDTIVDFTFHTVNTSGVPTTLAGTPALSVYKANGTTESTAGITLTVDFDSRTGLNHVRIDTSADVFYAIDNDYMVVITTGTVGGTSVVGYTVATFSIEKRFNEANVTQWSGSAVNALVSGRVDSSTGAMAANVLTATAIDTDAITSAKIAADAIGASEIANGAIDAATFAAGAIDATAIATNAIDADSLATDAVNEIRDAVTGGSYALDTDANGRIRVVDGTGVGEIDTAGGRVAITVAQVDSIVDNVWDEPLSGHNTLATFGQILHALGGVTGAVNDAGALATDFDTDGFTEATDSHFNGHVLVFTTGVLTGQSRIISTYTGIGQNIAFDRAFTEAPANNDEFVILGPLAGGLSRLIATESDGDAHTDVKQIEGLDATDQIRDAILSDATTFAGANIDAAITSRLAPTVAGRTLDVTTGGEAGLDLDNTSGTLAAAQIATDAITADKIAANAITSSELADGTITNAKFAAGAIDATAIATGAIDADALASDAVTEIRSLVNGTASGNGTSTTLVDTSRTEANDDHWKDQWILFTSGTAANINQVRLITGFTASSDTITFAPALNASTATSDGYEILPAASVDLRLWNGTAPNSLVAGAVDADVSNIQANTITAASIATDAIDADAIAANAITSSELADNAITSTKLAAGAITATTIATDAIDADAIATDGVNEIRDAVTGGSYALDTDANGRVRIVDGTGAGEIDTDTGRVQITEAQIDQIVDEVFDEPISGHTTLATLGQIVNALGARTGAVNDAGALATDFDVDGFTEATNDHFNGHILTFTTGALTGQSRVISDYVGAGQNVSFERAFTEAPANNDEFVIFGPLAGVLTRVIATESDGQAHADTKEIEGVDATNQVRDAILSDATTFPGASITEARLSELDAGTGGKAANQIDLIKTEADKIALVDAGTGVSGSVIEEVENLATPADVNAQVVDVLKTDTSTLPGQTAPPATPTLEEMITWLYKTFRNKKEQTATEWRLFNDAGSTVDAKATVSDSAGTATKEEVVTGP